VARESYGRLVAYLSSHTRDVASAEDALSDALVAVLRTWRETACRKIRRSGC
jgi:RNA polymerase sigma-70 factor (ECF subfamily)